MDYNYDNDISHSKLFKTRKWSYRMQTNKIPVTLSICFPTYNRHDILIENIKSFIGFLNDSTKIIISDNSEEISSNSLSFFTNQDKIEYYKNHNNIGVTRNFIKVLSIANSDYLLLMSDEDIPNLNALYRILSSDTFDFQDLLFSSKDNYLEQRDNLSYLFLPDNYYMSGFLFKRESIMFNDLEYELSLEGFGQLGFYPHMYIINTLLINGELLISTEKFYTQGEKLGLVDLDIVNNRPFYHPTSKILQFIVSTRFVSNNIFDQKRLHSIFSRLLKQFIIDISAFRVWSIRDSVDESPHYFVKTEEKYNSYKSYFIPICSAFNAIKSLEILTKYIIIKLFFLSVLYGIYYFFSSAYLLKDLHKLPTHKYVSKLIRSLSRIK